ncbi:MAG: hypothetical protein HGA31_06555 [Candidatus Moranbacteria bacterium]|nr:hypothetical protein [Candidatus Moranbacteria bacterium]
MVKARLNIRSDATDWRAKILSNLTLTPFRIGDICFRCVEAPLQGIKSEDPEVRKEIFAMDGFQAMRKGREVVRTYGVDGPPFVYWHDERIPYHSTEHRLLIAMFIREKIRQNREVQEALLETEGDFIYHDVGPENPNTTLPEKFYIEVLLYERRLLRKLQSLSLAK